MGQKSISYSDGAHDAIDKINSNFSELYRGGGGGSSSGGASNILNAKDYGAIGDWTTDDTESLEDLFETAANSGSAVYIPAGTYKIRRPLTIKSGMEIFGDGEATVIKKIPAVWTKLSQNESAGATNLHVESVSGFNVGDHIFLTNYYGNTSAPTTPSLYGARHCSFGEVTAIDSTNNIITFKSAYHSVKSGTVRAHQQGTYVSVSFPILRSWSFKDQCIGVYIHDICLDGNAQSGEPTDWTNACIHFDAYSAQSVEGIPYNNNTYDHFVERCKLINAAYDGISDQGEGNLVVRDCIIQDPFVHGIHVGTTFLNAKICGNTIEWTKSSAKAIGAGVFFCQNATHLIISNNKISKFRKGVSDQEYGSVGKDSVITGNVFSNIEGYVFDFSFSSSSITRGGGLIISNNFIEGLKNMMFFGDYLDNVLISHNLVKSVSSTPTNFISVTYSDNVIIDGNMYPSGTTISTPVLSTSTTNLKVVNNSWNT